MAIVPAITVRQELREGRLVRIPLRELSMPRRTLMIYREQGYLSDCARELIKMVRAFNWEAPLLERHPVPGRAIGAERPAPRAARALRGVKGPRYAPYGT